MEEKDKRKNGKVFTAFVVGSIRDVVDIIHENKIPREDMVSILRDKEEYVVFCYR